MQGGAFTVGVTMFILLAAVTVGMETDRAIMADPGTKAQVELLDWVVQLVFTGEIIFKMVAEELRPWRFFYSTWNSFDFLVVAISYNETTGAVAVLRLVRVLRIMKLVRYYPQLSVMVSALLVGLASMWYVETVHVLAGWLYHS